MTLTAPETLGTERTAVRRTYLMCRPDHFTVEYRINPWMHPEAPTDTARALGQWQSLHDLYLSLGHEVLLIDPVPGLPDMVYAANGGFTLDGTAYAPRFAHPERAGEAPAYSEWLSRNGFRVVQPRETNEGEGDLLLAGGVILAGTGFRSTGLSHGEVGEVFERQVVSLELVDPRFYHLDTALAVLDPVPAGDGSPVVAYFPGAFDERSREELERRYPDAILVAEDDAVWLGLNCVSDGRNVVIAEQATGYDRQLRERGYNPIGVDLSELLRGGGGAKCCTLELRR